MIDYGVRGVEVFHLALETWNILKKKQLWLNKIEKNNIYNHILILYCPFTPKKNFVTLSGGHAPELF